MVVKLGDVEAGDWDKRMVSAVSVVEMVHESAATRDCDEAVKTATK